MRSWILLFILLLQAGFAAGQGTITSALRNGMTFGRYLAEPVISSAELSPNGRWLSAVRLDGSKVYMMIQDLDAAEDGVKYVAFDDSTFINWIEWANDDWLLVSVTAYASLDGRSFTRRQLNSYTYDEFEAMPIPVTRLIIISRDGQTSRRVFDGVRSIERGNINLGEVVSFLPNDPDHFLIAAQLRGDLDVFKVQISTGDHERVGVGSHRTAGWFADANGEPAFRVDIDARATRLIYYGRKPTRNGDIKWRRLKSVRIGERSDAVKQSTEFRPIAPGPVTGTYYVAARPEGTTTTGIYLYNFETDSFETAVATHPTRDIEDAILNPETYEYLGSQHYEDRLIIDYADADRQAHIDGLSAFFEDKVNLEPLDSGRDGRRWLIHASGPRLPGSYYIYIPDEARIEPIGSAFPQLPETRLSDMQIVHYTARDGLSLTGYLTVPAGTPDGVVPPLVVMPHGGPEMRDVYQYNPWVQTLAAHGYAVFQPNFRGSSGYGLAFADAGRRQWGKAMQTDIEDGLAYLVAEGRADPGNTCILGYSYGGYAALVAATLTPDTYKCVISGAGPSDLVEMLDWVEDVDGRDSEEFEYWTRHIGHPSRDRSELQAVSPALHAEKVKAPVLLIHGDDDTIVPIEQSQLMLKALEAAGKDVTFVKLDRSGHSYRLATDESREMQAILGFLDDHLTVDPAIWAFGQ